MKYIAIIKYVLMAVSVLVIILGAVVSENVDLMLRWTYIILLLAIACVVLLPLFNVAQNPKGAVRGLIGAAAILIVAGIAYSIGSDVPVVTPSATHSNPMALKVSDAGLYLTYFAMVVAILAIFFGEIRNFFR